MSYKQEIIILYLIPLRTKAFCAFFASTETESKHHSNVWWRWAATHLLITGLEEARLMIDHFSPLVNARMQLALWDSKRINDNSILYESNVSNKL